MSRKLWTESFDTKFKWPQRSFLSCLCHKTRFLLLTLLCSGYTVKLKKLQNSGLFYNTVLLRSNYRNSTISERLRSIASILKIDFKFKVKSQTNCSRHGWNKSLRILKVVFDLSFGYLFIYNCDSAIFCRWFLFRYVHSLILWNHENNKIYFIRFYISI